MTTATPVTKAPAHDFSREPRGYKREILQDLERCACAHFSGNHDHYVWNSRCRIGGCACNIHTCMSRGTMACVICSRPMADAAKGDA